ncbi:hypothetical protein PUN28_005855 [Cardiocondyla obscurior]|uniref:Uncharacterized protein n=1 Tax=Cardiocondyla obscurior TaxID=286306 RepID=A0AAW2G7N3_9HYME
MSRLRGRDTASQRDAWIGKRTNVATRLRRYLSSPRGNSGNGGLIYVARAASRTPDSRYTVDKYSNAGVTAYRRANRTPPSAGPASLATFR